MRSNRNYKFKVIHGVLSWKNEEMERFMPVSAEILTQVILHYEKEFKNGVRIWKQLTENEVNGSSLKPNDPFVQELAAWMEQLHGLFENTEPLREKEKLLDNQIYLN
jgi:hypothetical protein